ncbi:MFS transporter [Nocardia wallacei]|uniref:MFS transporter n=3 Tax=Nocardia wallacei TaxID=480035 RepID=UPI002453EBD1|nr:MFS transporter [Nocardia wallacei]
MRVDAKAVPGARQWVLAGLLVTAMTLSMLPLFLVGALGPRLIDEFDGAASLLGALVAAGFAVAAVLSLIVGPMVAALGVRRCLVAMFVVSALALTLFAAAPGYPVLVAAIAVSGLAQALANPTTNQLIATRISADRRGSVAGWKQSGVQFGAFLAGLPLAAIAAATTWRVAVGAAAAGAAVAAALALAVTKDAAPPRVPRVEVATSAGDAGWMCGFSVLLGAGISAINTYIALYAADELSLSATTASMLVAVLGVAGITGRVGWTRWASRLRCSGVVLGPLAFGAAIATLAILAAAAGGAWLAWAGVLGIGGCAVAANAVSMMTVIATAAPEHVGRDSAVVSAGFFAGFVVGPPLFGVLAASGRHRYGPAWTLVAAEFLAAAAVAWWWQRRAAR